MAIALTITKITADGQDCSVYGNATITGSYTTSGDTANISTATQDANFQGPAVQIPSSLPPLQFDFWDVGGNIANGVFPVLGTTQANCKVIFTSAFNTQLSAGAYPGAITGSKYNWRAVFHKSI